MFYTLSQYVIYFFSSIDKYKVHSPFVFNFITKGLEKKNTIAYKKIEKARSFYQKNSDTIAREDYGAGSKKNKKGKLVMVNELMKRISIGKKYSQLLCDTIHYFQPKTIIELGTAFGVGTTALAASNTHEKILSIEGDKNLAALAKKNISHWNTKNIEIIIGNFDQKLPAILDTVKKIDLVYIDGNHTQEATVHYFNLLKKYITSDSILIFDDIYWSKEMTRAWENIKRDQSVSLTLDFFQFGMVFFRKEQKRKEHFKLWY